MAMKWKCVLDEKSILTGYEEVDETQLPADAVAFDVKPDLEPGHYRWNGLRFESCDRGKYWYTPDGPDAWYAVFLALAALQKQGVINFPQPVKLWLRYYFRSFGRPDDQDPGA
jgi:hypothetical protein